MTTATRPTPSAPTAGPPSAEAPRTLAEPVTRSLGLFDQLGLWGNLGVSILGFTGAIFVLNPTDGPPLSLGAALLALLVGTILGALAVALAAVPGADTGAPAMVLLRGLFGTRLSYLPTVLNIVQLLGWTTFELVTISTAMQQVTTGVPRWVYVLAGGVITTALALRPLGWIRVLRRYVTIAVLIALAYLFVQLLRNPLPGFADGSWHGFWIAVDTVVGVAVSWVPLASDYSRHSYTTRSAFTGAFVGYTVTQIVCYALGLVALVTVAHGDSDKIFGAFMAVPVGTLAFAVLAVRELDQSFADTYSTAVSVQNLRPRWDRRVLALVLGGLATVFALALNISDYENFLILIGSVFVPLLGVLVIDYFVISRRHWDLSENSPTRWAMLVPWLVGFAVYQLVNPGYIGWWVRGWGHVDSWLGFTPTSWMSASLLSFAAAAVVTLPLGLIRLGLLRRRKGPRVLIHPEVAEALDAGRPVVALESTIISHGLPRPDNLRIAREIEDAVRAGGATPATIAIVDGQARIGLDDAALARVAGEGVVKASVRDIATVSGCGADGATTVASTAHLAARAGITVFATGGLGGVHREARDSWDESADLTTLSRTPVVVVCAGVKSILDVPATLERLETLNVGVLGYQTNAFPGFYLADSGFPLEWRVDTPGEVAAVLRARVALGTDRYGLVLANPISELDELDRDLHDRTLHAGLAAARSAEVHGKDVTPFLLDFFHRETHGASLTANVALVLSNARLAAAVAAEYAG